MFKQNTRILHFLSTIILNDNIRYYILNNTLDNINFITKYKSYISQNKFKQKTLIYYLKNCIKKINSSHLQLELHNSLIMDYYIIY